MGVRRLRRVPASQKYCRYQRPPGAGRTWPVGDPVGTRDEFLRRRARRSARRADDAEAAAAVGAMAARIKAAPETAHAELDALEDELEHIAADRFAALARAELAPALARLGPGGQLIIDELDAAGWTPDAVEAATARAMAAAAVVKLMADREEDLP